LKVLLVTRTVLYFTDSTSYGGVEQVLLTILSKLDRRSWHPIVVHYPGSGITSFLEKARSLDVELRAVPQMRGKKDVGRMLQFERNLNASPPDIFPAQLHWPLS